MIGGIAGGTGRRWLVAALTASAVLTSGCTASVDPDELPGVYRDEETGSQITLGSDGTFSATAVSTDGSSRPGDFSGQWEFVDSSSSDFIMLDIKDGGRREVTGVQLYPSGDGTVEFRTPDEPPSLVLTKTAAP
ncbi:hypothetical protein DMA15_00700 [Streptomyces sp. WAC 01529]|uniref:hypothetical protein n=1 Tax=Streptomyces sp. WAC 01529 TaxID=2203205 RepID=UPI000F6FC334|nr:hypothetical protein [Streptomyces sp. WAC 01529]AZM51283.1 hypothetical protein DMA15_00700 [Streptomyces sp. WAC 01529]